LNKTIFPSSKRNKWILYILTLALFAFILSLFVGNKEVVNLDGTAASIDEIIISTLKTLFIIIPLFGFILGSLFSFVPFKKAKYKEKYLRTSLLIMLILEGLFFSLYLLGGLYELIK
jgi:hypothetical protein